MDKFVFTPELTKEDAQRIIDALNFQLFHKTYQSRIDQVLAKIETKRLIKRLRKVAKIQCPLEADKIYE